MPLATACRMASAHASSRRSKAKPRKKTEDDAAPAQGRPLWRGTLGFGLVQIPVKLVVAETHDELTFHQLDKRDMARIHYQRVNENTGEKVEWEDIVKGYEFDDGKVVVVDEKDFEKANVKATSSIDIQDFVARSEIPPMYFERPYVLVPDRGAAKAYAVLRAAMEKQESVAIALVVIRTRQHLCAVMPVGDVMVLELLRFDEELKPLSETAEQPAKGSVSQKEMALAEQLIESLRAKWEPSKYKDTYRHDLLRAIEKKAKTGKLPASSPKTKAPSSNVTDLLSLLKKSIAKTSSSKRTRAA